MSNDLPPSKVCLTNLDPVFDILVNGHKGYDWHWLKWLLTLIDMIILQLFLIFLGSLCNVSSIQLLKWSPIPQFSFKRTRLRRVRDLQATPQVKNDSQLNSFFHAGLIRTNEDLHQKAIIFTPMIVKTVTLSLILKQLPFLNPFKRKRPIPLIQALTKILLTLLSRDRMLR